VSDVAEPAPTTAGLSAVLGALIHLKRVARGLTQDALARAAGLHPMAVSKIERGVQADLGVETLRRLAAALSGDHGFRVTAAGLIAEAERWEARVRGTPDATARGARLAAVVTRLAMNEG
jgi:transcriptional regulator with XRE-family HTH domain